MQFTKITDELLLMGRNANPSGAGFCLPVVEENIKTVKGRVREHMVTLPLKLDISLLLWPVHFFVF